MTHRITVGLDGKPESAAAARRAGREAMQVGPASISSLPRSARRTRPSPSRPPGNAGAGHHATSPVAIVAHD